MKEMRDELLKLNKLGPLFVKYIIEQNTELQTRAIKVCKFDNIVQVLLGDELKQDQFEFMYNSMKVIYDSPLQEHLINIYKATDKTMTEVVIPEIVAYKAIMRIRDIQLTKAAEIRHEKEKLERKGPQEAPPEETEEQPKEEVKEDPVAKAKLENDPAYLAEQARLKEEADKKERETYGRFWVWEGYFNEKLQQKFLDTAEMLKHVNEHVLQDVEDFILLKGFKGMKMDAVKEKIEADRKQRIAHMMTGIKDQQERDRLAERHADFQKKREFMNKFRPHTSFWNLFDDNIIVDDRPPHLLRQGANPVLAYCDGRMEKILENITEIAVNLKQYEKEKWDNLEKRLHEVFEFDYKIYLDELGVGKEGADAAPQ